MVRRSAVGVELIDLHLRAGIRDLAARLAGGQPLEAAVRRTRDALLVPDAPP